MRAGAFARERRGQGEGGALALLFGSGRLGFAPSLCSFYSVWKHTHTHTHTESERERERERGEGTRVVGTFGMQRAVYRRNDGQRPVNFIIFRVISFRPSPPLLPASASHSLTRLFWFLPVDTRFQERALDRLSDHLHPVHRALHIFARLGMLADFKAWYLECRRPMSEMRSMITR